MMNSSAPRSASLAFVFALCASLGMTVVCGAAAPANPIRTYGQQIRTKMYIGPIGPLNCDPVGVLGAPPILPPFDIYIARSAAYMAFCAATDLAFGENPATGGIGLPLDARIASVVDLKVRCKDFNNGIPLAGSTITAVTSVGGAEPGGFTGVANAITTKNNLATDGTWSFVSSGHPDPNAEFSFTIHRPRANPDIWHRTDGKCTCVTDAMGKPALQTEIKFGSATRFPSHRAYYYSYPRPMVPAAQQKVASAADVTQSALSNLWYLPVVAAPLTKTGGESDASDACLQYIPLPPEPTPPDFDWTPLAQDWCSQLANCGYDTTGCAETYLENIANPITTPASPPADSSTVESGIDSNEIPCEQSEEYLDGTLDCAGTTATEPTSWGRIKSIYR